MGYANQGDHGDGDDDDTIEFEIEVVSSSSSSSSLAGSDQELRERADDLDVVQGGSACAPSATSSATDQARELPEASAIRESGPIDRASRGAEQKPLQMEPTSGGREIIIPNASVAVETGGLDATQPDNQESPIERLVAGGDERPDEGGPTSALCNSEERLVSSNDLTGALESNDDGGGGGGGPVEEPPEPPAPSTAPPRLEAAEDRMDSEMALGNREGLDQLVVEESPSFIELGPVEVGTSGGPNSGEPPSSEANSDLIEPPGCRPDGWLSSVAAAELQSDQQVDNCAGFCPADAEALIVTDTGPDHEPANEAGPVDGDEQGEPHEPAAAANGTVNVVDSSEEGRLGGGEESSAPKAPVELQDEGQEWALTEFELRQHAPVDISVALTDVGGGGGGGGGETAFKAPPVVILNEFGDEPDRWSCSPISAEREQSFSNDEDEEREAGAEDGVEVEEEVEEEGEEDEFGGSPGDRATLAEDLEQDLEREFDEEPEFERRNVVVKRNQDPRREYELGAELGRGKFGTVFRCLERVGGRQLAAKFIAMRRREDREDVEREVAIMSVLQHRRLLQLYDAFDDGREEMCLITELVEGGELFERIVDDDFELTEKKAAIFMRQICEGVDYMHGQLIVHLDMKPENILCLSRTGIRIKLIDFGLARRLDPATPVRVMFGTPDFAAPEVLAYEPVAPATDMWSVGVICYVLLSGLSPFMGENDLDTMANVTRASYDFDDQAFEPISELAKDFICKLLLRNPAERLKPAECLKHAWLQRGGVQLEAAVRERRESSALSGVTKAHRLAFEQLAAMAATSAAPTSATATTHSAESTPPLPPPGAMHAAHHRASFGGESTTSSGLVSLDKRRLKRYVMRRKWHKTVHAIMALNRMGANLNKLVAL